MDSCNNTKVNGLIFTRYLYIKEEVKCALILALLGKHEDIALFWGYELYYSGFEKETFAFLWSIYYDFYASINPAFEPYFISTHKEWIKNNSLENNLGNIIINLCIRPFSTDVFMLKNVVDQFVVDTNTMDKVISGVSSQKPELHIKIADWIAEHNYECLAQYILIECADSELFIILEEACAYFTWNGLVLNKNKVMGGFKKMLLYSSKHVLNMGRIITLGRIMQFYSMQTSIVKPKNIYLVMEDCDLTQFKTLMKTMKPNKILPLVYKYGINISGSLGLFNVNNTNKNANDNIVNCYHLKWLYYASLSPYWLNVIVSYDAIQDHNNQKIIFKDVIKEEEFYEDYWLDADEQTLEVQLKSTQQIDKANIREFYLKHKQHNVVNICDEYLNDFETISTF